MNKFEITVKSNPSGWMMIETSNDTYILESNETLDEVVTRLRLFGLGHSSNPWLWTMPAAILMVKRVK